MSNATKPTLDHSASSYTALACGKLTANIDPQGAQLMSLQKDGREYLWQGDPAFWPRRSPILFPIVGCLKNNAAQSAQGAISLGRHGLARNYTHQVIAQSNTRVVFELCSSQETRIQFPYDFCLNMTYELSDASLIQSFTVTNPANASSDLPFTLGAHPAFAVMPESFDSYRLLFSRPWTADIPLVDEDGLHDFNHMTRLFTKRNQFSPTYKTIEQHRTLVFSHVPDATIRYEDPSGNHGVELNFDGFDYFGVWTACTKAPFIALEPWCGVASCYDEDDTFEHKRGIMTLHPGKSITKVLSITPL